MIRLGLTPAEKCNLIATYREKHAVRNVVVLSPAAYDLHADGTDRVEYAEIIQYRHYYRLLREIGTDTLVVVNECLRTQDRHDLTYNCVRNFLNQTSHRIVFQYLPLIDTFDDFMTLLDFDTRSRFRRQKFEPSMLQDVDLEARPVPVAFTPVEVETPPALHDLYASEKKKLFDNLGAKDPHTLPRNLYLVGGRAKLPLIREDRHYLGRNNRFNLRNLSTYKEPGYPDGPYAVFELPHNFIDFADVVALSGQSHFRVLATELKADRWYLQRFTDWAGRIADGYSALHR